MSFGKLRAHREGVLLFLLISLGLVLRLIGLTRDVLWLDEANAAAIAFSDLQELFLRLRYDSSPPLYYFFLQSWTDLFGRSVIALRSLSLVAGIGGIIAVFLVGKRLFDLNTASVAGLIVAIAPIHIHYSQQTRQYTLLALCVLVSLYQLLRALEHPTWRNTLGYAAAILACLYLHNYTFYLLPAHLGIALCFPLSKLVTKQWLVAAACIVIGYLAWLPILLDQMDRMAFLGWLLPHWRANGPWNAMLLTMLSATVGWADNHAWIHFNWFLPKWGYLLAAAVAAASLFAVYRAETNLLGRLRAPAGGLFIYVVLTTFIALGASTFLSHPNYIPARFAMVIFPGLALLIARGICEIPNRWIRYIALAGAAGIFVVGLSASYKRPPEQGDRRIAERILQEAKPGDAVIFTGLTRASVQYYLQQSTRDLHLLSFPEDYAMHLGNEDRRELARRGPAVLANLARTTIERARTLAGKGTIYVVYLDRPPNRHLVQALQQDTNRTHRSLARYRLHRLGLYADVYAFRFTDAI